MMLNCLRVLFWNLILLLILFDLEQYGSCVEATPKHPRPLGSWFSSLEQIDFQDNRGISTTTDHIETTTQYKKKHRKRILKKKDKERLASEETKPKKKKKHQKKEERKFVKTILRERDGEYNASSSIENDDHRKPVDIIVHIKMHD